MREITAEEVPKLRMCIEALSSYHNGVAANFKGIYPIRPYDKTLANFADALNSHTSRIAVTEKDGVITGFCKIDLAAPNGKLDYLIVLNKYRGQGYGKKLMDWAMSAFKTCGITNIEVKVICGNPAQRLYEQYGFKPQAQILLYRT